MSRRHRRSRRRTSDTEILLGVALLLAGGIKLNDIWLTCALYGLILLVAAGLIFYSYRGWNRIRRRAQLATLTDVDTMDGLTFEEYVANLLRCHDYRHVRLTERSDFGVDIIAEKAGERWGVQTKRYAGRVSDYA